MIGDAKDGSTVDPADQGGHMAAACDDVASAAGREPDVLGASRHTHF
jgi:hypothetical protein